MNGEETKRPTDADAELQREIRAERKFTLSEAIGRMAGPGAMKGVSPVSPREQAEIEIQEYIGRHLPDTAGTLCGVLLRQVKESELLLRGFEQPRRVLAEFVRQVLDSEFDLKELVREADVEWGSVFGERPRFEKDGCPPAADDPYTHDSVRAALTQLAAALAADDS